MKNGRASALRAASPRGISKPQMAIRIKTVSDQRTIVSQAGKGP